MSAGRFSGLPKRWLASLLALLLSTAAAAATTPAPWPTREWPRSTPREQGIDPKAVLALTTALAQPGNFTDAVLVLRHGFLVSEAYFPPYTGQTPHDLRSVTKSVTGTLAAVAMAQGRLKFEQPVMPFFPLYRSADARQGRITVGHLLDMRAALAWKEWPYDASSDLIQMSRSADWLRYILSRPMGGEPGNAFDYCGALPHLLSALLAASTGKDTASFARQQLFGPLGIVNFTWSKDPQGIAIGESGLALTPRDLAKIGLLYLRGGVWDGQRLLPDWWVARVFNDSQPHHILLARGLPPNYASMWWVDPALPMALASGRHGQQLVLLPKQDIIVVVNARTPDDAASQMDIMALVRGVLLPGVDSTAAGAAKAVEERQFEQRMRAQTAELPLAGIAPPAAAMQVSGRTYRFDANAVGLEQLSLRFDARPGAHLSSHWRTAATDVQLELPFRIDGRSALSSPTALGVYATRAAWQDGTSLLIEMVVPGNSVATRMLLRFQGAAVQLTLTDGDGMRVVLLGRSG